MERDNEWTLADKNGIDLRRIFAAAKRSGPQIVRDSEGEFIVSFSKRKTEGSAQSFLTSGGPDDT